MNAKSKTLISTVVLLALLVGVAQAATWSEQAKLIASDAAAGDEFGWSVAVDGDTALVGAWHAESDGNTQQGAVYIFVRSGGTWIEQQRLTASNGKASNYFGCSVAVDSDTAIIGACGDYDNGMSAGAAYVYTRSGDTWSEDQKLTASDSTTDDLFGCSAAVDGDTIVVGAYGDDAHSGAAYVFVQSEGLS